MGDTGSPPGYTRAPADRGPSGLSCGLAEGAEPCRDAGAGRISVGSSCASAFACALVRTAVVLPAPLPVVFVPGSTPPPSAYRPVCRSVVDRDRDRDRADRTCLSAQGREPSVGSGCSKVPGPEALSAGGRGRHDGGSGGAPGHLAEVRGYGRAKATSPCAFIGRQRRPQHPVRLCASPLRRGHARTSHEADGCRTKAAAFILTLRRICELIGDQAIEGGPRDRRDDSHVPCRKYSCTRGK